MKGEHGRLEFSWMNQKDRRWKFELRNLEDEEMRKFKEIEIMEISFHKNFDLNRMEMEDRKWES